MGDETDAALGVGGYRTDSLTGEAGTAGKSLVVLLRVRGGIAKPFSSDAC